MLSITEIGGILNHNKFQSHVLRADAVFNMSKIQI